MKKFLAGIGLIVCSYQSMSQTLRLSDAINIALKNSLDLQLFKNRVEANATLNNYGVAGGLPLISAVATDDEQLSSIDQKFSDPSRNTQRSNAASNSLNASVSASMILYNGMSVVATKRRLDQLEKQSVQYLNSQVQNTIASIMSTYFDIVRQQSYTRTISESIEVSKLRLTILETQQSVGLANNADIFQAKLDLNALNQSLQSQLLIIEQAKTNLLTLLTLKPDSLINIQDTIIIDEAILLDSVLNNVQMVNADILAAQQQVRINELIVRETAALRYPAVRVNAAYNYNRNQNAAGFSLLNQSYGPSLGVNLAIPIYNGSALKRQQRVAEINTKNAQLSKDILLRDYTSNAVKTFQSYANTLKQLKVEQENYKVSRQLLNLVLERFRLRVATIIDVREAQRSYEDAGFRLINLAYAAKASEIELKRLSNTLSF
ncbi:MAG: TolC family protein [Chitinophagaceae bacterium]|nr:TolC family protein [Chitinophagaceae bacterium]